MRVVALVFVLLASLVAAVVVVLALVASFVAFFSFSTPVSVVKNGSLDFDRTTTVGDAFDGYRYFAATRWLPVSDERGQRVVFEGKLTDEADDNLVLRMTLGLDVSHLFGLVEPTETMRFYNRVVIDVDSIHLCYTFVQLDNGGFEYMSFGVRVLYKDGSSEYLPDCGRDLEALSNIYSNSPVNAMSVARCLIAEWFK